MELNLIGLCFPQVLQLYQVSNLKHGLMMADSSRFGINLVYAVKIAGILRGHQLPNQPEYYLKVSAPMWRAVC